MSLNRSILKKLVWSLIIAGTLGGGYFIYPKIFPSRDKNAWDLVPENALVVYESNQIVRVWNRISQQEFWENLSAIPFFARLENDILALDSLAGKGGQLDQILTGRPYLLSAHVKSKDELGFLLFIPVDHPGSSTTLEQVLGSTDAETETRVYQGFKIQEVKIQTDRLFAFLVPAITWSAVLLRYWLKTPYERQ